MNDVKELYSLWCKKVEKNADCLRKNYAHKNSEYCSLFCPLIILGTKVLADAGTESHGKGIDWDKCKALDL